MTWSSARIYLAGMAVLIAILCGGTPIRLHHDVNHGDVAEVVAYDATTSVVRWGGPDGDVVSRTGADGRDRWTQRIPGEPEVRALHVTRDAVYVRFTTGDERDGDRWVERIDLDG